MSQGVLKSSERQASFLQLTPSNPDIMVSGILTSIHLRCSLIISDFQEKQTKRAGSTVALPSLRGVTEVPAFEDHFALSDIADHPDRMNYLN